MVFVSGDGRADAFAFFLLPDKDESLRNVPKVINGWLNEKHCSADVTKCTTPYDSILLCLIAEIWPKAKVIGCSVEYHKKIKDFAKRNKGLGAEHKTKLTRLACPLCYLDERYFSIGIKVIEKYSVSEYGVNLVRHLCTKWLGILKSVHREQIMHRSLNICQQFSKQIERGYFLEKKHKHVWEFIKLLKTLTSEATCQMSRNKAGETTRGNFGCNTDLQKQKENRYQRDSVEFKENLKIMNVGIEGS